MRYSCFLFVGVLCTVLLLGNARADVIQCNQPMVPIADATPTEDVITVAADESIADVRVFVNITHDFIGNLNVDVQSPAGTTVRLHDEGAGDMDNISLTYSDLGFPNGSVPYDSGCVVTPSGPGALADFAGQMTLGDWTLTLEDVYVGGTVGTLDEWCLNTFEIAEPAPDAAAVQNLTCTSIGGTGVADLTWTNPVTYDSLNIFIEGLLIETIAGTATSYSTPPQGFPATIQVCVEGLVNGLGPPCPDACCNVWLPQLPADLIICSDVDVVIPFPGPPVLDTITVTDDQTVGDVQAFVDISHVFVGDVVIDFEHEGVSVRLSDETGGADDDFLLTYWDLGVPNESEPLNCGCPMQVSGPGLLQDLAGGSTLGDWTLIVEDVFTGQHANGTFNSWCLLTFQNASVSNLECTSASGTGIVEMTWENNSSYNSINIYVDQNLAATLPGTATSYTTLMQPVPSFVEVCVEPIEGAITYPQVCCSLDVIVDPVTDLTCTSTSGTGVATATWTLPAAGLDSINVYVNGVQEATLAGTDTTYTTPPQPTASTVEIGIQGFLNGLPAIPALCVVPILDTADVEGCSSPGAVISDAPVTDPVMDTIDIVDSTVIGDVETLINISHTFIGDLRLDLSSPGATTIRLHDFDLGGMADDMLVVFTDNGIPNSEPYDCGCFMQPSGPGVFADFVGELSEGPWDLAIVDDYPDADDGVLNTWCVRITSGCQVLPPNDLACTMNSADIELAWTNNDVYDEIGVTRDGALVATLPGSDTSYVDVSPPPGSHVYSVTGLSNALGCGNASEDCSAAVGITDVIFRGETGSGIVDSVAALKAALEANGRAVLVIDELTNAAVNSGGVPEVAWVCLGTFPAEHDLSDAEGIVLAELVTGDLGLDGTQDQPPTPIFIEGADVWGFAAQTPFEDYDGVENFDFGNIVDGNDSLIFLEGVDSGLGLDLSALGGVYTQDSPGNDFTDQIVPCDVNPDLGGSNSAVIWTTTTGGTYDVGVYYASSFAPVIAQSWELGGFAGSLDDLAGQYLEALLNPVPPMDTFVRGDADGNGSVTGIVDGLFILNFAFIPGNPPPPCFKAADANDDGSFSGIVDGLFILNFAFVAGSPPPPPPGPDTCGPDPTADALDCLEHPCP